MVEHYFNQRKPSKKENVMDDITQGQWSKKHYDDDYREDSILKDDDVLDPYTTQKSFRKIAKKLSRRI